MGRRWQPASPLGWPGSGNPCGPSGKSAAFSLLQPGHHLVKQTGQLPGRKEEPLGSSAPFGPTPCGFDSKHLPLLSAPLKRSSHPCKCQESEGNQEKRLELGGGSTYLKEVRGSACMMPVAAGNCECAHVSVCVGKHVRGSEGKPCV